jgi:FKBP-type peptidyl-prolyl cis-trans isomerase SlyD
MEVQKDKVVGLTYRLYVDDGESGKEFREEATKERPLVFLYGHQPLLKKFEEAILGKKAGDRFTVEIGYDDAYGDYDESRITYLPKTSFKDRNGKVMKDLLKVGNVVSLRNDKGNPVRATILRLEPLRVQVDLNHPLAGFDLSFEGEIIHVRNAEPEEIDHGHVHGPGGYHH